MRKREEKTKIGRTNSWLVLVWVSRRWWREEKKIYNHVHKHSRTTRCVYIFCIQWSPRNEINFAINSIRYGEQMEFKGEREKACNARSGKMARLRKSASRTESTIKMFCLASVFLFYFRIGHVLHLFLVNSSLRIKIFMRARRSQNVLHQHTRARLFSGKMLGQLFRQVIRLEDAFIDKRRQIWLRFEPFAKLISPIEAIRGYSRQKGKEGGGAW